MSTSLSRPLQLNFKTFSLAFLALSGETTTASPFISSAIVPISENSTTPTLSSDCTQLSNSNIAFVWRRAESTINKVTTARLTEITSETTCSQNTLNYQPRNQDLDNGGWVDVWFADENNQGSIVFQQYDKNTTEIGDIRLAFPDVSQTQGNAAITKLSDGRIVISCTVAQFPVGPGKKGPGVIYQGYSSNMDLLPTFKGNAYGPNLGEHYDSALNPTPDGGFDISLTAEGKIIRVHIDADNNKSEPEIIKEDVNYYYYHPSSASLVDGSVEAWAETTLKGDTVAAYQFNQYINSSKVGEDQTLKIPPAISWTKVWMVFQTYLKVIPDPFGGFTLLGRVNDTVVQQHFYSLMDPSGPITTLTEASDPYLQISGCPTDNGWINVISNSTGLYAQTNTFTPPPSPTTSPTQTSTTVSTFHPTALPTSRPSPHPTSSTHPPLSPTLSPTPSPLHPNSISLPPVSILFITMISCMSCVFSVAGGVIWYARHRYAHPTPYRYFY